MRTTKSVNSLRLHGNPNWRGRGGGGKPATKEERKSRQAFGEDLKDYLRANPAKRRKLVEMTVKYALSGHARYLELILDRMEGPVKHIELPGGTTFNFNFSDAERQRALDSVQMIERMRLIQLPPLQEKKEDGDQSSDTGTKEPPANGTVQ